MWTSINLRSIWLCKTFAISRSMKFFIAATLVSLLLITARHLPVMGAKEEQEGREGDMLTHRLSSNSVYRSPIEELLTLIGPEDLYPLCYKMTSYYDRYAKRGPTFNAWGGKKRTLSGTLSQHFGKRNEKSNFNPWGGKRSEAEDADYILNRQIQNSEGDLDKPSFGSWGGR